jgi:hypothetical protein
MVLFKVLLLLVIFSTLVWLGTPKLFNPIFFISSFTSNGAVLLNATSFVGSAYLGNLALTSSYLFIQGKNTYERFSSALTLGSEARTVTPSNNVLLSDIATQSLYTLLSSTKQYLTAPGSVSYIQFLSTSGSGIPLGAEKLVTLSQPIPVGTGAAFFNGVERLVVADADTTTVYNIDLNSGLVTTISSTCEMRWQVSNGWYSVGVAELFSFDVTSLVYGNSFGSLERQYLNADGTIEPVSTFSSSATEELTSAPMSFSQLSSLSVDINNGLWYFYHNGFSPSLGNRYPSTLGYAKASFIEQLPTSQPSGQPSSRPTFIPLAPKIITISIFPFRTSSLFTLTIDSRSDYAGTIHCSSFTNTTSSFFPSVNSIVINGYSSVFAAHQTSVNITVKNLSPVTSYSSFCYVTTTDGLVSSNTQIRNSRRLFSTQCCKGLSFSNFPVSLYSDSSKYLNQPPSSFTYSFVLSFLPKGSVTITPLLLANDGSVVSSSIVAATPASFSFTSVSVSLSGSFILAPSSISFQGKYQLKLNLTGSSASEYSSLSSAITFLSANSVPPSPKLSLVIFGDSGVDMYFVFDSSTNLAGMTYGKDWRCGLVFSFASANSTTCSWLNTTSIHGVFQSVSNTSSLLSVSQPVTLLPRTIKALCTSSFSSAQCSSFNYSSSQSFSILSPYHPVSPTVILRMPTSVGSCDNVTIDTTQTSGFGGRSWLTVKWSVSALSGDGNVPGILLALNRHGKDVLRTFILSRSLFGSGTYSVSLSVTNFLGVSSTASGIINAINNPNIPQVNILGGNSFSVFAYQSLTIYSSVSFASCTDTSNTKLNYVWKVFRDQKEESLQLTGKDPSILSLKPYQLIAGVQYVLNLNASSVINGRIVGSAIAVAAVIVGNGQIHAFVKGGGTRQLPVDQNMTLDGSTSYDEDASTNTALLFDWSCSIKSFNGFGGNCDEIIASETRTTQLATILGSKMTANYSYNVLLTVQSTDGRVASAFVDITPLTIGSAKTSVASSLIKFNSNTNFTLDGTISSLYSVKASWAAFVNNVKYDFVSYSPQEISLPSSYVSSGFMYSLVIAAYSFTPGTMVSFQITATPSGSDIVGKTSSSSITLMANGPPTNGILTVSPTTGTALSTKFFLQTTGWVDDPDDYPLTTSFTYSLSPENPPLTIQAQSTITSVTSTFPAGLESYDFGILLQLTIFDLYQASDNRTSYINVTTSEKGTNITDYLFNGLQSAFASSNGQTAMLTVNNAASSFNNKNCSAVNSTYCSSLHRVACTTIPQTCGSCLSGYKGIVGPSNTLCFPSNSSSGQTGSSCLSNDDCLFANCVSGVCVDPVLKCPSSIVGSDCSGHGVCSYTNPVGDFYDSPCLITNVYCYASCLCFDNYGGSDCSLDPDTAVERDTNRALLCESIIAVTNISNPSPALIDTLVSSLHESYEPGEASTETTREICEEALNVLTDYIVEGYLQGTASSTTGYLISLTSKYVSNSSSSSVGNTLTNITSGIFSTLSNGQSPLSVTSENIRITVRKDLLADLENALLGPPATAAEEAYNSPGSSFYIVGDAAAKACTSHNGYSHSSVMQWGKNPYSNSSSIESPLMGFSGKFDSSSSSLSLEELQNTTYFIILQFVKPQSFNFTALKAEKEYQAIHHHPSQAAYLPSNHTFPECSLYNGERYVSCGNCNVSTYTNYNVTFVCRDISQLCGGGSGSNSGRRLSSNKYVNNLYLHSMMENDGIRRFLSADDDYFSDDSTNIGSGMSVQQYGALLSAVSKSFLSTLTANPFNVNIEEAKPVIAFLGSLFLIFVIGMIGFTTWDSYDRNQLIYANHWPPKQPEALKQLKRKLIKKKVKASELDKKEKRIDEILKEGELKFSNKKGKLIKLPSFLNGEGTPASAKTRASDYDSNEGSPNKSKKEKRFSFSAKSPSLSSSSQSTSTKYKEKKKEKNLVFSANISDFFDLVLPDIFEKSNFFSLLKAIAIRHDYITIFWRASAETNRFIRWIDLYNGILSGVFISTLFFGTFYANTGMCETFQVSYMSSFRTFSFPFLFLSFSFPSSPYFRHNMIVFFQLTRSHQILNVFGSLIMMILMMMLLLVSVC